MIDNFDDESSPSQSGAYSVCSDCESVIDVNIPSSIKIPNPLGEILDSLSVISCPEIAESLDTESRWAISPAFNIIMPMAPEERDA